MADTPKYIGIIVQPYKNGSVEMDQVAEGDDEELVSAETRSRYILRKSANEFNDQALEPFYDIYERKRTSGSDQPPQPPNQPPAV